MMTKQTEEALKMAIDDAITKFINDVSDDNDSDSTWQSYAMQAAEMIRIRIKNACKEALEQPEQEPVALLEALSYLEHQQWMKWAQSIMDSEPISDARKQRWATMMVDYKDLPDNIQEYDREWARKVLAITHPCALARTAPSWQGNKEFVGLSDDERFIIVQNADWDNPNDIAELIEQALKEKNTC